MNKRPFKWVENKEYFNGFVFERSGKDYYLDGLLYKIASKKYVILNYLFQ